MINKNELEARIEDKVYPKVTHEDLDDAIDSHNFVTVDNVTICVISLHNGYTLTGINEGSVDPRNFDREIGEKMSYDLARSKLWPLLGFALAEKLHKDN